MPGYIDDKNVLSDSQDITASAASTNHLNYDETSPDRGTGKKLQVELIVKQAFEASGSATLQISLQDSADASSYADILALPAIGKASLVVGKTLYLPIPEGKHRKCLRLYYTVTTGPMTAGKIFAHVIPG